MLEAKSFLNMLHRYEIPVATACALPETSVLGGLQRHGLSPYFNTVVTAADGGATEVEWYFMYAAQQIQRPPMRCIVIGESNTTVEAAHELGMKCIVVAGNNPVYNFTSADLVVKDLSQLSFLNLKKLFGEERLVEPRLSPEETEQVPTKYEAFSDGFEDDGMEDNQASKRALSGQGLAFYR
jgi:beta-phosphoglucomutase-like phosphatase (HAD superfamily)